MIRLTAMLVRNPALTHEEFLRHWHDVHGPLIRDTAELDAFISEPAYAEKLAPDERRLLDMDSIKVAFTEEPVVVIDGSVS